MDYIGCFLSQNHGDSVFWISLSIYIHLFLVEGLISNIFSDVLFWCSVVLCQLWLVSVMLLFSFLHMRR